MSSYSCMPALMAAIEYSPKKQQKINKIMKKETKITAPDGCEIENVELVDGVAVVTFREKERKLPKSWEEFCATYPVKEGECFIEGYGGIERHDIKRFGKQRKWDNLTPDRATAEAVLALCQLIQLRNCYNGDWVPDWESGELKFFIHFDAGQIKEYDWYNLATSPLYFKTIELRDEFLRNFRPLIEKLNPLYGIKKGGEE